MHYLKIPHQHAQDILSLYEASDEITALAEQYQTPAAVIEKAIEAELFADTALFLAHALPVREAIWWACCCASQRNDWNEDEANAIRSARAWVHEPDETARRFAEDMAKKADLQTGAGWVAQAAFWSGGSMTAPSEPLVQPPEYLYSQAVAGAVNLIAALPDGEHAIERYEHYFKLGLHIAQGGNGQLGE